MFNCLSCTCRVWWEPCKEICYMIEGLFQVKAGSYCMCLLMLYHPLNILQSCMWSHFNHVTAVSLCVWCFASYGRYPQCLMGTQWDHHNQPLFISKIRRKLRCLPKRQLIAYIILACNWSTIVAVRLCWIASTYNIRVIIVGTYIF